MILEIYIDTLWSMLRFMSCRWIFMQGELFEILEDDKCLPEEQVQAIAKQLVICSHDYCIWLNWLFSFPVFWFTIMFNLGISNFILRNSQVRALHYLHSNRIIHRDMKPQNILIGAGSVVKVEQSDNITTCLRASIY